MSEDTSRVSFFDELKRRKVYQTTVAYGTAVFVVWQAADIAFPTLGLPPSLLRFVVIAALLGFPVAIVLSWLFEVVPQTPAGGEKTRRRALIRRPLLVAVSLVLLLGVAAWTLLPRAAAALPGGAWVLVADVKNETGDTLFDGALDDVLRLSLAQSSHLNLLPPSRIREGLQEMRRSGDGHLDESTAIELALRQGVSVVALPSLRRMGSRYELRTRLVDPSSEELVGSRSETAASEADILPAMDRLARQLRLDLGETLRSMVRTPIRLDRATTSSLEALKAWTEANRLEFAAREDEAGLLYRRAVELDSTFALAQSALGQWYYWQQNDHVRGDSALDRALAHMDGVSERERLLIEGNAMEWRGQRDAAAVVYKALTELMPLDAIAWGKLGYVNLRLNHDDEAIRAYERVLAIDSLDANAWANLATLRYGKGELAAAVPLYERAFRLQPKMRMLAVLNEEYGQDLVLQGRFDDADSLYSVMLAGTPSARARGLRSKALARMFRGKYADAADLLQQAIVLQHSVGARISEVRDGAFLATVYLHMGRRRDAEREIRTVGDLCVRAQVPPFLLEVAGAIAARAGHLEIAAELLDTAVVRAGGTPDDRIAVEQLRGEISLAEGSPERAIEHLEQARALSESGDAPPVRVLVPLAEAKWAQGDREAAVTLLQETVRLKGANTSRENQEPWIMAHYRLGRFQEELGRSEEARAAYQRFLDIWGVADPELPEVSDARTRLGRLTSG